MECVTSFILFGIVFTLLLIFIYMKKAHSFFQRLGISGPQPAPFFGIFPEYKKKGITELDLELINKYGNVVGIYHGHKPVVLVADPEMIQDICITKFNKFKNRKVNLDLGPLLRKTVALSDNGQWTFLREHISEVFKPNYLEQITGKLLQSTEHLIHNIEEKLTAENDFDFQELCLAFSVDSLCNSLFGYNVNSYKDREDKTVDMIKKGWMAGTAGIARPAVACAVCPAMTKIFSAFSYNAIPTDVRKYLTNLVTKKMKKRHTEGGRTDLLSFIMTSSRRRSIIVDSQNNTTKSAENMASDYRLSETEIVANCLFFFLAGYDTTASTIVFTLYCLAKHPECQDKVLSEISNNLSSENLSYDDIENLQYLDMVLNETLRIFPTYLRYGRAVGEDTVIKGIKFPKGTEIQFPIYAIHRNKDNFPNPEKFDPNRFSKENVSKRHPMSFIPFGAGPRDCFGQSYAKLAVKIAVVSLIQKYKFSLSSKQNDPPTLAKTFYLRPENGLWLTVDRRTADL
ncbi:cytochrome P450 3A13-like isoform X1 [Mytilus galloprovincialis]|uniref:cytochrome P450 3A13-like isoform X1 n=1 Tax=Mytilus galloprovincialis TaxID=29158 RepID=UPI003F7BB2DB